MSSINELIYISILFISEYFHFTIETTVDLAFCFSDAFIGHVFNIPLNLTCIKDIIDSYKGHEW